MANVLNRITLQYLESVNTPEYPIKDWIINPDISSVENVCCAYWKLDEEKPVEMNQAEKDAIDAALLAARPQLPQEPDQFLLK